MLNEIDLLASAFSTYNKLLDIEYEIIIKNAGCIEKIAEERFSFQTDGSLGKIILLKFSQENFYHLTGFQHSEIEKLTRYNRNGKTQSDFYKDIKNKKLLIDDLEKSIKKEYLLHRLEILRNLEKIIDSSVIISEYDGYLHYFDKQKNLVKTSKKISAANCFLYTDDCCQLAFPQANNVFIFFSLNEVRKFPAKTPKFFTYFFNPCSIVIKENLYEENYLLGHKKLNVLIKKKNKRTKTKETLYIAPGYVIHNPKILETEQIYYKSDKNRLKELLAHPKITAELKERAEEMLTDFFNIQS